MMERRNVKRNLNDKYIRCQACSLYIADTFHPILTAFMPVLLPNDEKRWPTLLYVIFDAFFCSAGEKLLPLTTLALYAK